MGGSCFRLRFRGRELWLVAGTYDIGRGSACHIRIDDPRVSRRHAELIVTSATEARIRDAGSINGVSVDGERVGNEHAKLAPGSRIAIGSEVITVEASTLHTPRETVETLDEDRVTVPGVEVFPVRAGGDEDTVPSSSKRDAERPATRTGDTQRTDALELYAPVARSAIAMGRAEDAEALMGTHLRAVLSRLQEGGVVLPSSVRGAVDMAVELAGAGRVGWFEFVMDVYEVLRVVPPAEVASGLARAIERQPHLDLLRLRAWVNALRGRVQEIRPEDFPTIDRLETMAADAVRRRV